MMILERKYNIKTCYISEVVAVNQQDYRANQKIFKYGGGDVHEIYEYPASAG